MSEQHPDDEFHPPTSDDPYWTETCWFTFTVPERRLSGQLYPFFRPNQGVLSAGAFFWDHTGGTPADILHARQFWHLPIPEQPLSDIALPNGITYRCVEPLRRYALTYDDPDAVAPPPAPSTSTSCSTPSRPPTISASPTSTNRGGTWAPSSSAARRSRWTRSGSGTARGGRARSSARGIHNSAAMSGGYSYATASEGHAFHAITMDFGTGALAIHGYILRDGERSKVTSGTRRVLERDPRTAYPLRVALDLVDESGRELHAEGECRNGLGLFLNPNLYTVNCLTEWTFDGIAAFGEDHDNWSATGIREFLRGEMKERNT